MKKVIKAIRKLLRLDWQVVQFHDGTYGACRGLKYKDYLDMTGATQGDVDDKDHGKPLVWYKPEYVYKYCRTNSVTRALDTINLWNKPSKSFIIKHSTVLTEKDLTLHVLKE